MSRLYSLQRRLTRISVALTVCLLAGSIKVQAQDRLADVEASPAQSTDLSNSLKPLSAVSLAVLTSEVEAPEDRFARDSVSVRGNALSVRNQMTYSWVAPGLAHKPLYTEDVNLERYGWSYRPVVQPFASGVHFLKDAALLPYQMGLDSPCDVQCNLGYRRPGTCAPQVKKRLPWSWKGAVLQGGAVVGAAALIP